MGFPKTIGVEDGMRGSTLGFTSIGFFSLVTGFVGVKEIGLEVSSVGEGLVGIRGGVFEVGVEDGEVSEYRPSKTGLVKGS